MTGADDCAGLVGAAVVGSAVVDGAGAVVVGGSVVGSVVVGDSVEVVVTAMLVVDAEVVAVGGGGVLGDAVVGPVLEGSMAVDVDVASGGAAARPAHAATVKNAASAHARNVMEQYYYDTSPSRRGEQPLH
jgi:CO/xanthine dehydrogenase FAD-binding subunit